LQTGDGTDRGQFGSSGLVALSVQFLDDGSLASGLVPGAGDEEDCWFG
jgi:hypothetical protein